ncbi:hypothetical protein GCM10007989_15380 [Devosia pacifica]|uniref:Lipopolysaccharide assembly protein A domain-containing protein n=1 Tax=Devosia pacifica TaxID=1335967 RepID=A0A918S3J0_9HYPH|nr:lipopolysaccharide assembly protein LapA domain-containing protein [Devosia pacifica]GHA21107.1 hypothetical protein GCM10007989_15380 [Devosia pacifica]
MFKKIAGWIILVPLCVILVAFALANRQLVSLNVNPFTPNDGLDAPGAGVPMFLVLYAVLLVGVLLGGIATWFAQSRHRHNERHWRREAHQLSRELETLKRQTRPTPSRSREVDDLLEIR